MRIVNLPSATAVLEQIGVIVQPHNNPSHFDFGKELLIKSRHNEEIIDTGFTYDLYIEHKTTDKAPKTINEVKNQWADVNFWLTIRDFNYNIRSESRRNNLIINGTCNSFFDVGLFRLIHDKLEEFSELPKVGNILNGRKIKKIHTEIYNGEELKKAIEDSNELVKLDGLNGNSIKWYLADVHNSKPNKQFIKVVRNNNPLSISVTYAILD